MLARDVLLRQTDVARHLLGKVALDLAVEAVAQKQRGGELGLGEVARALEELVVGELLAVLGLAVVLRDGREGREQLHVVGVVARDRRRPVEDGRQHHDAVEPDAALLERAAQHRVARGAVGLAEQVERRVPATRLLEPGGDEAGEAVGVGVDAPRTLGLDALGEHGPSRAQRVDEHQVADLEQRAGVVLDRIGRGADAPVAVGDHAARADAADVHQDARASRTAVEAEAHRARGVGLAVGADRGVGQAEQRPDRVAVVLGNPNVAGAHRIGDLALGGTPRQRRLDGFGDLLEGALGLGVATGAAAGLLFATLV